MSSDPAATTTTPAPKYDVGFSFLNEDLGVARELAALVEPELSTFIYDRRQEDVGGTDGMTSFARVFKHDVRLAVILLRTRWGHTPMTAVEEAAIKERAQRTRFTSFMLVGMEENVVVPEWIPAYTIYQHGWREPRAETAAVIKARARDVGAVLKVESFVEATKRRAAERQQLAERAQFLKTAKGAAAARAEAIRMMQEAVQRAADLTAEIPELQFQATRQEYLGQRPCCVIQSGSGYPAPSLTLAWEQPFGNSLTNASLQVGEVRRSGEKHWSYYQFTHTKAGELGWLEDVNHDSSSAVFFLMGREATSSADFLEERLQSFVEHTLFSGS